jgi:hypothetical protein
VVTQHTFWIWLLALGVCSPWIVASIVYWRLLPHDGFIPPSYGAHLRRR